jgi:hypothetical protein
MAILSDNLTVVMDGAEASSFRVGRSRKNQAAFVGLVCGAICVFLLFGPTSVFTVVFVLLAIWQGLQTYVVRTEFGAERLDHRDRLGNWRAAQYAGLLVQRDPGESVTISCDDLTGRNLTFKISKMDGDPDLVEEFLRDKIG